MAGGIAPSTSTVGGAGMGGLPPLHPAGSGAAMGGQWPPLTYCTRPSPLRPTPGVAVASSELKTQGGRWGLEDASQGHAPGCQSPGTVRPGPLCPAVFPTRPPHLLWVAYRGGTRRTPGGCPSRPSSTVGPSVYSGGGVLNITYWEVKGGGAGPNRDSGCPGRNQPAPRMPGWERSSSPSVAMQLTQQM